MASPEATPEWGVNQVRLTAFPTPAAVAETENWWEKVTGEIPDTAVSNPKQAGFEARGVFADGTLILRTQPLRIDWLYTATAPDALPTFIDTIGPFSIVLEKFLKLMTNWFGQPDCPPLQRLAFGAVLLRSVDSRQMGYERLGAYLPFVQLDAQHSSDFSYQINRPRDSKVNPALSLNRLSRWSVSASQAFMASEAGLALGGKHHACRLEVDINTTPENTEELPKEKLPELFRELESLGVEIAENGDVA